MNFCVNCKHKIIETFLFRTRYVCGHPKLQLIDYVTGEKTYIDCNFIRENLKNSNNCPLYQELE